MIRYPPNPCRDCQDRHVGCHANCERHLDWQRRKDAEKEKLKQANLSEDIVYAYNRSAKERAEQVRRNNHGRGIKLANYGNKEIGIVDPNLDLESYS